MRTKGKTTKERTKMIVKKLNSPISEYYVYKVSDLGTRGEMLSNLATLINGYGSPLVQFF